MSKLMNQSGQREVAWVINTQYILIPANSLHFDLKIANCPSWSNSLTLLFKENILFILIRIRLSVIKKVNIKFKKHLWMRQLGSQRQISVVLVKVNGANGKKNCCTYSFTLIFCCYISECLIKIIISFNFRSL